MATTEQGLTHWVADETWISRHTVFDVRNRVVDPTPTFLQVKDIPLVNEFATF